MTAKKRAQLSPTGDGRWMLVVCGQVCGELDELPTEMESVVEGLHYAIERREHQVRAEMADPFKVWFDDFLAHGGEVTLAQRELLDACGLPTPQVSESLKKISTGDLLDELGKRNAGMAKRTSPTVAVNLEHAEPFFVRHGKQVMRVLIEHYEMRHGVSPRFNISGSPFLEPMSTTISLDLVVDQRFEAEKEKT